MVINHDMRNPRMPGRIGSSRRCRRHPWFLWLSACQLYRCRRRKEAPLRKAKEPQKGATKKPANCHPCSQGHFLTLFSFGSFQLCTVWSLVWRESCISTPILDVRFQTVKKLYMYPNDGFDSMLKHPRCCRLSLF